MNSFYSAFLLYINNSTTNEISKNFQTVVHIVIHNCCNNGDIHRSLKINIFFKANLKVERKAHSTLKSHFTQKIYLRSMN